MMSTDELKELFENVGFELKLSDEQEDSYFVFQPVIEKGKNDSYELITYKRMPTKLRNIIFHDISAYEERIPLEEERLLVLRHALPQSEKNEILRQLVAEHCRFTLTHKEIIALRDKLTSVIDWIEERNKKRDLGDG